MSRSDFMNFMLQNIKNKVKETPRVDTAETQQSVAKSLESQQQFFDYLSDSASSRNLASLFSLVAKNVNFDGNHGDGDKKIDALANMLATKPSALQQVDVKKYFDSVCFQLRDLVMYHDEEKGELPVARLAAYTTIVFLKRKPTLTKRLIIYPLFDTLRCMFDADLAHSVPFERSSADPTCATTDLNGNRILVNEKVLEASIRALTLLVSMEPLPFLMDQLESIFPHLLVLNLYSFSSKLLLVNQELTQLVQLLLNLNDNPCSLLRTSFEKSVVWSAGGICTGKFVGKFVPGSSGGVMIVARNACLSNLEEEEENTTIIDPSALVAFIQKQDEIFFSASSSSSSKKDSKEEKRGEGGGLAGDFFVEIVESHLRLRRNQCAEDEDEDDDLDLDLDVNGNPRENKDSSTLYGNSTLEVEKKQHQALLEKYATDILVMYATLILEMLEKFGDSLLQKTFQILKFVRVCVLDTDDLESINLGITLLTFILGETEEKDDQDKEGPILFSPKEISVLREINVVLSTLSQCEDDSISTLASLARLKLAATLSPSSDSVGSGGGLDSNDCSSSSLGIFRSAIKDLADELVPIRASGLSKLSGLVLAKDKVATMHIDSLCTIFFDLLSDEDSFIYLNAVKACSALTETYPKHAIEPLTGRYKNETLSIAYRTRIGECLLRTVQRLGEAITSPHHARLLVTSVFVAMRSPQAELQASALVLLSQIARQGCIVLESCIHQLFDYINHVLSRHVRLASPADRSSVEVLKGVLVLVYEVVLAFGVDLQGLVRAEVVAKTRWCVDEIASGASGNLVCQGHAERIQMLAQDLWFATL